MTTLATVTLETSTGQPSDAIVNTFAFLGTTDQALAAERTALMDQIWAFYNTPAAGATNAIGEYLSVFIERNTPVHTVRLYEITDLTGTGPNGSPVAEKSYSLTAAALSATALPHEVALRMRLETAGRADEPVEQPDGADPGTEVDRPKQRATGGPYLGPFNSSAASPLAGASQGRPSATLITDVIEAAKALAVPVPVGLGTDFQLAIWSRQDALFKGAAFVAVDDEWDTQRSRGRQASQLLRSAIP